MSFDRDRLLDALSRVYRRDPLPVAALTLTYDGTAPLTVGLTDAALTLSTPDNTLLARDLDTQPLTLGDLVALLNTVPAVTATLTDPATAAVAAATLLDVPFSAVGPLGIEEVVVFRFTNPVWQLFDPVRRRLKLKRSHLDVAIAQLDLLSAAGSFADFWGTFTGTPRHAGEGDDAYTARQLHELLRQRTNNQALAAILEEDAGVEVVEVVDLRPEVFRCSGTPLRGFPLAGPHYNACVCEVRLAGFPTRLAVEVARAHVAAGITVFVRGNLDLSDRTSLLRLGGPGGVSEGLMVGSPPAMVIGTGTIGIGAID